MKILHLNFYFDCLFLTHLFVRFVRKICISCCKLPAFKIKPQIRFTRMYHFQAEEEKGSESQGERSGEEEKVEEKEEKVEKEEGKGGGEGSSEQSKEGGGGGGGGEEEKSKPGGEKRKSCEEKGEGSRRSTGSDRYDCMCLKNLSNTRSLGTKLKP